MNPIAIWLIVIFSPCILAFLILSVLEVKDYIKNKLINYIDKELCINQRVKIHQDHLEILGKRIDTIWKYIKI